MKFALVIGGAECVWDDYERAKQLVLGRIIETFVINDSIPLFPHWLDHAITLHPNKLKDWAHKRNEAGLNIPRQVWSHRSAPYVTNHTPDWGGSSGLFACKVALELGYHHIILCGVPMDETQKHIVRKVKWAPARAFQRAWGIHEKEIRGYVKSFGGWTGQKFGAPTLEWINADINHVVA